MVKLPKVYYDPTPIEQGIARAAAKLKPDVVRIGYKLGEDWSGDPALFFRVVLVEGASCGERLRQTADRAEAVVLAEVDPYELGLQHYFSFRTEAELTELQEQAWA